MTNGQGSVRKQRPDADPVLIWSEIGTRRTWLRWTIETIAADPILHFTSKQRALDDLSLPFIRSTNLSRPTEGNQRSLTSR